MSSADRYVFHFGSSAAGPPPHACHCIGCCRKCGQCQTAPWHPATCDRIAALNAERDRIVREATS